MSSNIRRYGPLILIDKNGSGHEFTPENCGVCHSRNTEYVVVLDYPMAMMNTQCVNCHTIWDDGSLHKMIKISPEDVNKLF